MEFYYATFFSPAKSKWLWAITQGYPQGCPGLTLNWAMKYILHTKLTTIKCNLNQKQQGTWSIAMDDHLVQEPWNMKSNQVFIVIANIEVKIYLIKLGASPFNQVTATIMLWLSLFMMPKLSCLTPLKISPLINWCVFSIMRMLNSMPQASNYTTQIRQRIFHGPTNVHHHQQHSLTIHASWDTPYKCSQMCHTNMEESL